MSRMDKHLGFTGTKTGTAKAQMQTIKEELRSRVSWWLHHGDCQGADYEVHSFAVTVLGMRVALHPPTNNRLRMHCPSDIIHPAKNYLDRNHDIVDACDELLAAPKGFTEEHRSGTWATIRYARNNGKRIIIVWPDGRTSIEPAKGIPKLT